MKILQNKPLSKLLFFAAMTLFFACSVEDGVDGANGTDGVDGVAGANGVDGVNGNANAQTFVFTNTVANNGDLTLIIPEITKDVIDNYVVLGYIQNGVTVSSLPYRNGTTTIIGGFYQLGKYHFRTYDENNAQTGFAGDNLLNSIETYKVVIIESSSIKNITGNESGKNTISKNGKAAILKELSKAKVDIHDYYAVCDYYGLKYR